MIVDYSPFTPGQPVPVELFVGRDKELRRLSEHVGAAAQGRLRVAFLSGERGIGKSSLAAYVKSLAEQRHNMVGAHVLLGGANSVAELVRRVFEVMLHESKDKKWYDGIKDFFANTIKSADLFGLKLSFMPSEEQLTMLVRNFSNAICQLIQRLQKEGRAVGLTLVLDNINGLAESREFADWLKSLIDDIAINRQMPLCILLVGLEERRRSLVALNPSLARAFDLFEIEPWSDGEAAEFYRDAFDSVGIRIDPSAMSLMVQYAGGLPAVAHEIGDAVIRMDDDKVIGKGDAAAGIMDAAHNVGQKHIQQQVLDAIKSKKYRSILQKLVTHRSFTDLRFSRTALKHLASKDEAAGVDNFLHRMKELGVIVPDDEEGPGSYALTSHMLAIYLFMKFSAPTR